jgi:hypothetical protein
MAEGKKDFSRKGGYQGGFGIISWKSLNPRVQRIFS